LINDIYLSYVNEIYYPMESYASYIHIALGYNAFEKNYNAYFSGNMVIIHFIIYDDDLKHLSSLSYFFFSNN